MKFVSPYYMLDCLALPPHPLYVKLHLSIRSHREQRDVVDDWPLPITRSLFTRDVTDKRLTMDGTVIAETRLQN